MGLIAVKRIYDPWTEEDGRRIFVDRLWARGLTKEEAHIDIWMKEIAPSTELRKWFAHDPEKWPEFKKRYAVELDNNPCVLSLREYIRKENVTLLYGARDEKHNDAAALKEYLDEDGGSPA